MNFRTTWILVLVAVCLLGFVYFVEVPWQRSQELAKRPKRLLPGFDERAIQTIEVMRGNQVINLVKTAEGWELSSPIHYRANQLRVEGLLTQIGELTSRSVLSDEELLARGPVTKEFGLSPPHVTMVLKQTGGAGRTELLLGNRAVGGREVYFQLVGIPGIFMTDAALLERLPMAVDEWRDPSFVNLKGLLFDRLTARAGPYSFELRRDSTNEGWQLTKPQPPARADSTRVGALLHRLESAQVSQFLPTAAATDYESLGLQPAVVELSFAQGASDALTVQFGNSPTNNDTVVYARRGGGTNLVLVGRELLDLILNSAFDLRDRRLLSFSAADVETIEVKSTENFVVAKQTNNSWAVVQPRQFAADQHLMGEFFANLADLEIIAIAKDVVIDFSTFGLNNPFQYTLKRGGPSRSQSSDQVLAQIDFGRTNTEGGNMTVFTRRPNDNSVYEVSFGAYISLPAEAYKLRDRRVWNFSSTDVASITINQQKQTRQILRSPKGEWSLAPVYKGEVNPFSPEETAKDFGQLQAEHWVEHGTERLKLFGFEETAHEVVFEVRRGGRTDNHRIQFGRISHARTPYASVVLDGETLIFEIPMTIYQDVLRDLTLPPTPAP
jgi:hypothetical protein